MDSDFIELLADKKALHDLVDALPEGSKGIFVWVNADRPNVVSSRLFGTLAKMLVWEMLGILQIASIGIYQDRLSDPEP